MDSKKSNTRVLIEMRPALEGFAGIPQEVRLLFRGLRTVDSLDVEGMIQTSTRVLSRGKGKAGLFSRELTESQKLNKYSRVIISMAEKPYRSVFDKIADYIEKKATSTKLLAGTYIGLGSVKLSSFESASFEDFTWRTLFAKTLPSSDFDLVAPTNHKICSTPWQTLHMVGLSSLSLSKNPKYPTLNTRDVDIFIGQTPYPGTVTKNTSMVIRYHDAIPVLMPHTISDKSLHQATHFYALKSNVKNGAWFACVSEATRQDLIKMFPEADKRSVTIHNMVSHHYYPEDSSRDRLPDIIRSRQHADFEDETKAYGLVPKFLTLREKENFYKKNLESSKLRYILVVSTLEPRKNHSRLLAAWEVIKADIDPDIKLVVVGGLGWDYKKIVKGFQPRIDRGEVFLLSGVPSPDLRVLYRHAEATVCPSLGEGFDFSGVESMASGGVTIASDIPVHKEVYGDAAEYFDPYTTMSLVNSIKKVLYAEDASKVRESLRKKGGEVAKRYLPENILPQWEKFLERIENKEEYTDEDREALFASNVISLRSDTSVEESPLGRQAKEGRG
ncbi:MAG: glycosyltransferase family 4 protein [bacterium]